MPLEKSSVAFAAQLPLHWLDCRQRLGAGVGARTAHSLLSVLSTRQYAQAACGSGGTADALASGASPSNRVGVQIPASAPFRNPRHDGLTAYCAVALIAGVCA